MTSLMERLERTRAPTGRGANAPRWPINPDGPEAAALIRDLDRVLQIIADETSWRGFSPVAQVERMRQLAASATLFTRASQP